MNDLTTQTTQLPDTIEDLTQFVLVGKATLQAYMMKLQTVNRLSVAQEIRDQTLKEAQEVSTAVIAAEQRIGELLLAIPKQSGMRTDIKTSDERETEVKTKTEIIKEMGYGSTEAKDYQQMAKNPEVVQKVIENALANGDVVTKSSVMKEIKALKEENERLRDDNRTLAKRSEPQVIEKEVIKEVVPADYDDLKRKADEAETYKRLHQSMTDKWRASEAELDSLKKQINDPIEKRELDLKQECIFFCTGIRNFIERYGGYAYLKSEIDNLPKRERDGYLTAVKELQIWADTLLGEISIGG